MRSRTRALGGAMLVLGAAGAVLSVAGAHLVGATPGPGALLAILTGHVLLAAMVVGVIGAAAGVTRGTVTALAIIGLLAAARLGPEWVSLPARAIEDDRALSVLSWNLELGSANPSLLAEVLVSHDADLVALQEVTPEAAAAIERDARLVERYPWRWLEADPGVLGMAILSRHPMESLDRSTDPAALVVTVETDHGVVTVVDVHPMPGRIALVPGTRLPIGFDPAGRDAGLRAVRSIIDPHIERGRVIVIGDLNVAPTEPGARIVLDGLLDVHAEVGQGPGWTWRPSRFEATELAFLRIDYVLVSPGLRPVGTGVDCRWTGDHCVVTATVDLVGSE